MDNCKSDMAPRQCGGWSPWSWRLNNLTISMGTGTQNPVSQSFNLFVKALAFHFTNHTGAISLTLANWNVPVYIFLLSSRWAKWHTQIRCSETLSLLVMPVSFLRGFLDTCIEHSFHSFLVQEECNSLLTDHITMLRSSLVPVFLMWATKQECPNKDVLMISR